MLNDTHEADVKLRLVADLIVDNLGVSAYYIHYNLGMSRFYRLRNEIVAAGRCIYWMSFGLTKLNCRRLPTH